MNVSFMMTDYSLAIIADPLLRIFLLIIKAHHSYLWEPNYDPTHQQSY